MNQPPYYIIRPMDQDDISTVVYIDRLSFPAPWPISAYIHELNYNKRSRYYVLLRPSIEEQDSVRLRWRQWLSTIAGLSPGDSRIIGYVGFRLLNGGVEAHISTIAVRPEWRGKGLGELLLLTALEEAIDLNVASVTLEVRASNKVAQKLYEKYSFQFVGINPSYYHDGEDAWLMRVMVSRANYRLHLGVLRRAMDARLSRDTTPVGQKKLDTL